MVCLTEESVELLWKLGLSDSIVGVSAWVKRPPEARKKKRVCNFLEAKIDDIQALKPDLVLGYSDIQKDMARELIGAGLNVWIGNQRSLTEILEWMLQLAGLFGVRTKGEKIVGAYWRKMEKISKVKRARKPRVYFEEWDDPMISGIRWVSEMIELCGGEDVFASRRKESLAKGRIVTVAEVLEKKPDIFLGCWCGKRLKPDAVCARLGNAMAVHELAPEVFLQPGPAPFEDGLGILSQLFDEWQVPANVV